MNFLFLAVLTFAGLLTFASADCTIDDQVYANGDTVPSPDCNTCTCTDGGRSCTRKACPTCTVDGVEYQWGDRVPSKDCNTCTCRGGVVGCTRMYCPQCIVNGTRYDNGDYVPSDPTLRCTCEQTEVKCVQREPCQYKGKTYQPGDSFKDSCNTCFCGGPHVGCTLMGCPIKVS